jgi:hypothetical protein
MGARTRAALLLAAAALAGQLATVADQLFVTHVTCLAHGERIHVANEGPARLAARWTEIGAAATESPPDAHAQCLFDDDVDCVPAPAAVTLPPPRGAAAPASYLESARPLPRQPLYRLAPKNSPPAQVA